MKTDAKFTRVVGCETCGNQYEQCMERCPLCQSNQRSPLRSANDDDNPPSVIAAIHASKRSVPRLVNNPAKDAREHQVRP
jgi:hypothetical protein